MKATNATTAMVGMDPEAVLAATAAKQGNEDRKAAKARKRSAQKDRIRQMEHATEKLREMADNTLYQGILKAAPVACDVASKVVSSTSSAAGGFAGGSAGAAIKAGGGEVAGAISKAGQAAAVAGQIDPFGIINTYKQADKSEIDANAERESHNVQAAADAVGEAQRLAGSMSNLMQKLSETRHAARMAAIKG
jgi:hypothetical protein